VRDATNDRLEGYMLPDENAPEPLAFNGQVVPGPFRNWPSAHPCRE
jgi:hypothetical protein